MPSRTSKPRPSRPSPWKAALACSESELKEASRALSAELRPGDRVLLEGPLGAGKSTFARALLESLRVSQPAEGSPTFAIAHVYGWGNASVAHVDFYRIRSESEIDEAGLPDHFWDRNTLTIAEWLSSWPGFQARVTSSPNPGSSNWTVELAFVEGDPAARKLEIRRA